MSTMAGWNVGAILAYVPNDITLGTNATRYVIDAYGWQGGPVDIKAEVAYGIGTNENTVARRTRMSPASVPTSARPCPSAR